VGIRATPIAEAMLALVLMDHALRHRAQNADVVCYTPRIPGRTVQHDGAISDGTVKPGNAVDDTDPDEP
jgi:chorismate synthase